VATGIQASEFDIQLANNEIQRRKWSKTKLSAKLGVARSTVTRFFQGQPIQEDIFQKIAQLLDVELVGVADTDREDTASTIEHFKTDEQLSLPRQRSSRQTLTSTVLQSVASTQNIHTDWGEAPDASIFYGRATELALLEQWIVTDQCRLVALLGMGGIGKTSLSVKLTERIHSQFDYCVWRSLREAPPVEKVLTDLIKFLSDQRETEIPNTVGGLVTRLIQHLQQSRCLLVLDNAESILDGDTKAGHYRAGYEGYGILIERVGTSRHQSCLMITSREKPKELAKLGGHDYILPSSETSQEVTEIKGRHRPVRSLLLHGLENDVGQEFLKAEGLDDTNNQWKQVFDAYSGNPLALKITVNTIQDLFRGNISEFLRQGTAVFGDIRDLLEQQFERLSKLEQSVMYWLAINREPTAISELKEDTLEPSSPQQLLEVLESLKRRSLIERVDEGFTLQNVLMEYVIERFVATISEEIHTQQISLFHSHALMKATAKDYVRETQVRLILKPVKRRISNLDEQVTATLDIIRQQARWSNGYAAGNLLNLLCQSELEVRDLDFSKLTLRQAYLKGIKLHELNFSKSAFVKPSLTHTFSSIYAVAFSSNGKLFATGDDDGHIQLWRVKDQKQLATLDGHIDWVRSISFSPNSQFLASGSDDSTIRIWDIHQFPCKCVQVFKGHEHWVWSVAFSPDSRLLASGGADSTIQLWDIQKRQHLHTFTGHTNFVRSVTFSTDGQFLASASDDFTIRLWDIQKRRHLHTFTGHTNFVWSVAFSSDGHFLASGSDDSTIRLWDIQKRQCFEILTGHTNWVRSVAFSPDGQVLASSSADSTIRLWNIQKRQCFEILTGHTNWVRSVAFSPDGQVLASSSADSTIRLWDVPRRQCVYVFAGYSNWIRSVAFSPDGRFLASGSDDTTIRLWDIQERKCIHIFTGHTNWVRSVAFSPDARFLASGSADSTIRLWDVQKRQCIDVFTEHANFVRSVVFSPNGRLLASGSEDTTIRLWDIQERKCIHIFTGHTNWVSSVAFSPDGQFLVSGSDDSTIRLWDIQKRQCVYTFSECTNFIWSVTYSPDGQFLASGSDDHRVRIWNVQQRKCVHTFEGHTNFVWSVSYNPDGQLLASGSADSTIRLWDIQKQKCVHTFEGHTDWVRSVAFSPDAQVLSSSSNDGTIRLWNVQTGKCLAILQSPRPYEGTNIVGVEGLTGSQRASMLALGAIEGNQCDR